MKKILCLLLCLLLVLPLAACKKGGDPNAIFVNTESSSESDKDIKDTVKVSFPLSVVDEEYRDNLDAYCEKYGSDAKGRISLFKFVNKLCCVVICPCAFVAFKHIGRNIAAQCKNVFNAAFFNGFNLPAHHLLC